MKKIGIIGFGRFGELLAKLSREVFDIHIIESNPRASQKAADSGYKVIAFEKLADMDYIFLAVPISLIESTLVKLAPLVSQDQVVIDLCSVKIYPTRLMKQYLKNTQILASHPMFGPDSARNGLKGFQVAICPINIKPENLQIITKFWTDQGVIVLETTPELHDQDTIYSQAFTYTVARIILNMDLGNIVFRTKSYNDITEIAALSIKDSEQLFHDMLFYNPYLSQMREKLTESIKRTNVLLDDISTEQALSQLQAVDQSLVANQTL